jgi:hypothetical protein
MRGLPEGLSALTALQTLNLSQCTGLRALIRNDTLNLLLSSVHIVFTAEMT